MSWLDDGVERGGRLVEQQHLGLVGEGAGERDALRLAAGELVDRLVAEGVRQADAAQQAAGLLVRRAGAAPSAGRRSPAARPSPAQPRPVQHVVHDGAVEQRRGLEDHADAAPQLLHRQLGGRHAVEQHAPAVGSMSRLMVRSSVLLPEPDGPEHGEDVRRPATLKLTSSRMQARARPAPRRRVRSTPDAPRSAMPRRVRWARSAASRAVRRRLR